MTPAIIMDPTNSTAETSNIPTMEMNGHDNANEKLEGSANLSATTQNPNTYDELFPTLGNPGKTVNAGEINPLENKWGSKPKMIIPPTITQVKQKHVVSILYFCYYDDKPESINPDPIDVAPVFLILILISFSVKVVNRRTI